MTPSTGITPHYWGGNRVHPFGAVRAGDWKLIEFYEDMRVELYNLKDDLGEARDLAKINPEKADELRERLHQWRQSVDAQMPVPNPSYRAARPGEKQDQPGDQALLLRSAQD